MNNATTFAICREIQQLHANSHTAVQNPYYRNAYLESKKKNTGAEKQ